LRPRFFEEHNDGVVAAFLRIGERRLALVVLRVHVSAGFEKQARGVGLAGGGGREQGGHAVPVFGSVDVGPLIVHGRGRSV